jgi:hypothetical protein
MDFVFKCLSCHGPLLARKDLCGLRVQCAHCSAGIEIRPTDLVTEAVVSAFLDAPAPARPVLRRVRPAPRHASAGAAHAQPRLIRGARITHLP